MNSLVTEGEMTFTSFHDQLDPGFLRYSGTPGKVPQLKIPNCWASRCESSTQRKKKLVLALMFQS